MNDPIISLIEKLLTDFPPLIFFLILAYVFWKVASQASTITRQNQGGTRANGNPEFTPSFGASPSNAPVRVAASRRRAAAEASGRDEVRQTSFSDFKAAGSSPSPAHDAQDASPFETEEVQPSCAAPLVQDWVLRSVIFWQIMQPSPGMRHYRRMRGTG